MSGPIAILPHGDLIQMKRYCDRRFGKDDSQYRLGQMLNCVFDGGHPQCGCGLIPDHVLAAAELAASVADSEQSRLVSRATSLANWMRQANAEEGIDG